MYMYNIPKAIWIVRTCILHVATLQRIDQCTYTHVHADHTVPLMQTPAGTGPMLTCFPCRWFEVNLNTNFDQLFLLSTQTQSEAYTLYIHCTLIFLMYMYKDQGLTNTQETGVSIGILSTISSVLYFIYTYMYTQHVSPGVLPRVLPSKILRHRRRV